MKSVNLYLFFILAAVLLTVACAPKSQMQSGILLSDSYKEIHQKYLGIYGSSDEETQSYMRMHIAPIMNRTKKEIIEYNDIVLLGGDGKEQRSAIMYKIKLLYKELKGIK